MQFGGQGVLGAEPVNRDFDLAAVGGVAANCCRIVGAANLNDIAVFVFVDAGAGDQIGIAQANFAARREAEEFLGRVFHKVGAVDPQFAAKRQFAAALFGMGRIERRIEPFDFAFGVVFDEDFDGLGDAHHARGDFVEVFADAVFEQSDVDHRIAFVYANDFAEIADRFGRKATAAHTRNRRHTGIVPAAYIAVFDQA